MGRGRDKVEDGKRKRYCREGRRRRGRKKK